MQKLLNILTVAVLMAGAAFAQERSESVSDIFRELIAYEPSLAPVPQPAPVAAKDKPATLVQSAKPPTAIQAVAAEPSVDAMVEESRELYRDGEFAKALQGISDIIKIAPENIAARMYLRTLLERDHRTAEIEGMKAVDAAWSTDLVLRSYTLTSGARERMKLDDVTGDVDVETLFPQVDFPKESSAIYQPETETIFVHNTSENLAVLETMLEAMGVLKGSGDTEQVEIEAKFVEVSEGILEELGFEWRTQNGSDVGIVDDVNIPGGQYLFDDALRGGPSGPSMPFSQLSNLGSGQTAASGDWSTFRMEDTFSPEPDKMTVKYRGPVSLDVLISALDQSSGTDVLSAPRIVTRSGEEATLRVGELHSYPEAYEGDSSEATILNVSYQDFEEKLLGIELAVTPEVDENHITLALNPTITELAGWQTYQLAPANSIYNHRQNLGYSKYNHAEIVARLPIFKERSIETTVTIADGSTIGMGGLISEKIEAFEDRVPVLGSIPLVGRLFRNEGERVIKRNLLMFVTATKVEPSGRISAFRSFE